MGKKKRTHLNEAIYAKDIPDLASIQPREAANVIGQIFATRCRHIGTNIIKRAEQERESNIDNFDSGPGLEDIIREELLHLCPRRYLVTAGTIDDRAGRTAGDYEIVIADDFWTPILKAGAIKTSRKVHLPIEAVYGVVEVKQSIDLHILDLAMEKLIMCHRLYRPPLPAKKILENTNLEFLIDIGNEEYHLTVDGEEPNPLFSAILAVNIKPGTSIDDLATRFVLLNQQLKRQEVVQVLCVLREGCASWIYFDDEGAKAALFRGDDLERSIYLAITGREEGNHPFYYFAVHLLRSLFLTKLVVDELPDIYGPTFQKGSCIFNPKVDLSHPPDSGKAKKTKMERMVLKGIKENRRKITEKMP